MWQFILGSDEAFVALEERARQTCVRFPNQQMPPGAVPDRAATGFEVDPVTGVVRLLVDRSITYTGPVDEIRGWFEAGEKCFDNFEGLRRWLDTTLRPVFEGSMVICSVDLDNTLPS